MGSLVLLTDEPSSGSGTYYSSSKSHHVVRIVLVRKLYAIPNDKDLALVVKDDLIVALGQDIPRAVRTDSLSVFNVVISTAILTTEK